MNIPWQERISLGVVKWSFFRFKVESRRWTMLKLISCYTRRWSMQISIQWSFVSSAHPCCFFCAFFPWFDVCWRWLKLDCRQKVVLECSFRLSPKGAEDSFWRPLDCCLDVVDHNQVRVRVSVRVRVRVNLRLEISSPLCLDTLAC